MASAEQEECRVFVKIFGYNINLMASIGHGTFGSVYKGKEDDNSTVVAIKKISLLRKPEPNRIVSQTTKLLILDVGDENVITVNRVEQYKDSMWIITEYCDLGNLNSLLNIEKQSVDNSATFRLKLMAQIAKGLAFLHENNIVHRDIKPANILLKREQNSAVVKISDFELSRILDPDESSAAMSSDIGTVAFKAPEFWQRNPKGQMRYNTNVDVYALGLTFLAMIQAQPGRNLTPKMEGHLEFSERRMPVGLVVASRLTSQYPRTERLGPNDEEWCLNGYPDVNIVEVNKMKDDDHIQLVKNVIRGMTRANPHDRLTAKAVEVKLREMLGTNNIHLELEPQPED